MMKCKAKPGGEGRNAEKMTKCSAKPGGEGRNNEYFKRLTVVRLVRGTLGNIERVKRKGNEAPHTLEENDRERNYVNP
jgi:hypothetical protein